MNKTTIDGMSYETTGNKKSKKADLKLVSDMSSGAIVRYLIHKHRHALIATYATLITAYLVYDKIITFAIHGV